MTVESRPVVSDTDALVTELIELIPSRGEGGVHAQRYRRILEALVSERDRANTAEAEVRTMREADVTAGRVALQRALAAENAIAGAREWLIAQNMRMPRDAAQQLTSILFGGERVNNGK